MFHNPYLFSVFNLHYPPLRVLSSFRFYSGRFYGTPVSIALQLRFANRIKNKVTLQEPNSLVCFMLALVFGIL